MQCLWRPEGVTSPGLVIDGCELPHGGWGLNKDPLEEQTVLFTAEHTFSPCDIDF